jgi:hypothetical protein
MALDGNKAAALTDDATVPAAIQPSHLNPQGPPAVISNKQLWYEVDESTSPPKIKVYASWNGTAQLVAISDVVVP